MVRAAPDESAGCSPAEVTCHGRPEAVPLSQAPAVAERIADPLALRPALRARRITRAGTRSHSTLWLLWQRGEPIRAGWEEPGWSQCELAGRPPASPLRCAAACDHREDLPARSCPPVGAQAGEDLDMQPTGCI